MGHITKAQAADLGKAWAWIGLSSILEVVVLLWLQDYAMPGRIGYFIPALILFADMVREDFYHQTVDIRKVTVLAFLFARLSRLSLYLFMLRWVSGCIVFGAFYLGALRYCPVCPVGEMESADTDTSGRLALSFLPSFALAILVDAVYHISWYGIHGMSDVAFLPEIDAVFETAWEIAPQIVCTGGMLLAVWLSYQGVRYYVRAAKKKDVIVEGMGFGDFLFLPLFTALLGWSEFSMLYMTSLIVHLIRGFLARKGEDRGCP